MTVTTSTAGRAAQRAAGTRVSAEQASIWRRLEIGPTDAPPGGANVLREEENSPEGAAATIEKAATHSYGTATICLSAHPDASPVPQHSHVKGSDVAFDRHSNRLVSSQIAQCKEYVSSSKDQRNRYMHASFKKIRNLRNVSANSSKKKSFWNYGTYTGVPINVPRIGQTQNDGRNKVKRADTRGQITDSDFQLVSILNKITKKKIKQRNSTRKTRQFASQLAVFFGRLSAHRRL